METNKRLIWQLMLVIVALGGVLLMSFKPSELFGKSIALRTGVVSEIQKQVEQRQPHDPHDELVKDIRTYTYIAKFLLNGSPIVAKFQDPYQIDEGDVLHVSGIQTAQYFDVLAYRNETKQFTGSNKWWASALAGFAFALAAVLIFFNLIQEPKWYEQFFFLTLFSIGVFLIIRGFYIKEALDMLKPS